LDPGAWNFLSRGYFLEFPGIAFKTPARNGTGDGMKTLHSYLTRQVLVTLVMTVGVFTFVMMLVSILKEVLGLLVNRQVDFLTVLQAVGLLIPYVLPFALPMGMLTATLLVFGRFSADNELTAVRASGVSLVSLVTPVLLLSVGLSGVSAWINLQLAPQCRTAYKQLILNVGTAQAGSFITEKTYLKDFNTNTIVYVSKVRETNLEDVVVLTVLDPRRQSLSRAERGVISFNPSNRVFTVSLSNVVEVLWEDGRLLKPSSGETAEFSFTNVMPRAARRRADLGDLTFQELRDELRILEERMAASAPVGKMSTEDLREKLQQLKSQRKLDLTLPVRMHMHRQVSFSFACIGFTLVGIPLGIRAHRRETTFGIALALLLVVLYYSFFLVGLSLETRPDLTPHLILWWPNFVFQAVGIVLLWRANRGV
jgi:lipopolysaccharide export system permease protein